MRLENKSIVVTGASAGMGHAIVERFAQEGANIIAVARRLDRLEELAESLKDAPGRVVPCQGDMGDPETSVRMIDLAVKEFGRLDVLVNNAGIMDDNTAVGDVSDEMLYELFRVNTYGPIYAMRKAVQTFIAQGEEQGNIINITSVGAVHQTAGVAYCASKAALWAATRNTVFMYEEQGIRCNAIAPGFIATDMTRGQGENPMLAQIPLGRMGAPEEVAQAAAFLAQAAYITGEVLRVDGGIAM